MVELVCVFHSPLHMFDIYHRKLTAPPPPPRRHAALSLRENEPVNNRATYGLPNPTSVERILLAVFQMYVGYYDSCDTCHGSSQRGGCWWLSAELDSCRGPLILIGWCVHEECLNIIVCPTVITLLHIPTRRHHSPQFTRKYVRWRPGACISDQTRSQCFAEDIFQSPDALM